MPAINIDELAAAIVAALRGELTDGWTSVSTFAGKQARRLATQAALMTEGRITHQIDDELLDFFEDQLKEITINFARAMAMRTIITLQRAWNAIVGVVWDTVNGALGAARFGTLPVPAAPTH